jgi:hypothetical protein
MTDLSEIPRIDVDVIKQVRDLSRMLVQEGQEANQEIIEGVWEVYQKIAPKTAKGKTMRSPIPMEICVAITIGWLGPQAVEAHARKAFNLMRKKGATPQDVENFLHPKGNAARMMIRLWKPEAESAGMPWLPDHATLKRIYNASVKDNPKWSTLAPIKLYLMNCSWTAAQINDFYMPLGKNVRAGYAEIFGLKLQENPASYKLAQRTALHLARFTGASVLDVNSGLYSIGCSLPD